MFSLSKVHFQEVVLRVIISELIRLHEEEIEALKQQHEKIINELKQQHADEIRTLLVSCFFC